jgi:hypothetical protein
VEVWKSVFRRGGGSCGSGRLFRRPSGDEDDDEDDENEEEDV